MPRQNLSRRPIQLRRGRADVLKGGIVALKSIEQRRVRRLGWVVHLYQSSRLAFLRRIKLRVIGPRHARHPVIIAQRLLRDVVAQQPRFKAVALHVIGDDQFDQRLIRGEIDFVMESFSLGANAFEQCDAQQFNVTSLIARNGFGLCPRGVVADLNKVLRKLVGRRARARLDPFDRAQQNAEPAGAQTKYFRRL